MANPQQDQTNYQNEIKAELGQLDPADFSHASRLLGEELKKSETGNVEPPRDNCQKSTMKDHKRCLPKSESHYRNFLGSILLGNCWALREIH
ncbi:hypothetical protein ScPMuIL_005492 [Solemya velum]